MISRETFVRADAARDREGEGTSQVVTTAPFAVFRLGRIWMAADALLVGEIATATELTAIPGAPPRIPGLINLRGRAVPLLDLAVYFDLPPEDYATNELHRVLVATAHGMRVGIPCDQVTGVVHLPVDAIKPVQVQRTAKMARFSRGEIEQDYGLVTVIELDAVLEAARVGGT